MFQQPIPLDLFGPGKSGSQSNPGQSEDQQSETQSDGIQNPSAFRQKFQGIWNKPFFFVTPARREELLDAAEKR